MGSPDRSRTTERAPVRRSFERTATLAACALSFACVPVVEKPEVPVGVSVTNSPTIEYAFSSLDRRPVSRAAFAGKPTVLGFVTTWDLQSQAQTEYLVKMFDTDGDKVNYALVSFDDRKNRELVEEYVRTLKVKFPVAQADVDTVAGRGPFGAIAVPSVAVLDSFGRLVWAKGGLTKPDEVRGALRAAK